MKATGIIRTVDKMGRIVIPKEIRKYLGVQNEVDSFEIFMEGELIVLKKYQPACIFCDNICDCVEFNKKAVCKNCIDKLKKLEEETE